MPFEADKKQVLPAEFQRIEGWTGLPDEHGFIPDEYQEILGFTPDTGFIPDDPEKETIGFGEAFVEDPLGKLPFSPKRMVDMVGLIQASRRVTSGDYKQSFFLPEQEGLLPSDIGYVPPVQRPGLLEKQKQFDIGLMEDYLLEQSIKADRGYSTLGRVGQIVSEMPSFVVEFMATGGLNKIGSETAKKIGAKLLRAHAATTAGKAAIATGGLAAGAALRSVGMPHRAAEAILKRQVPRGMEIDDEGSVTIEGPVEGAATSVWKGLTDHYIEILSESAGELIGPVATGAFAKIPLMGKLIPKLQAKWIGMQSGRTVAGFAKKIGNATGFHGTLSEVGEEFLGDTLRAITDVEDFGAGEDAGMAQRIVAGVEQDVENLPAMILAFAIPGVARYGAGKVIDAQIEKDREIQKELDFLTGRERNLPTQIVTAEGVIGFEDISEDPKIKQEFKEPGVLKYITPKWLLNRQLGIETTLEDVTNAHEAAQLEQQDLKSWINTTITKLKKEKDLTRLPDVLEAEAVKEWTGDEAEIFAMGEDAPVNIYRTVDGKVVLDESQATMEPTPEGGTKLVLDGKELVLDTKLTAFAADVRQGKAGPDVTKTKAHVLQKKLDGSDNPVHIMRDLLDTYEYAPEFLSKSEANIFNAIRTLTRSMRQRANEARKSQGLPEIEDVEGYITHWMDHTADGIMDGSLVTSDPTIRGLMINPTSKERTVKRLNEYFSKDLGRLLNMMVQFDLRDIHLSNPVNAALEEVSQLVKSKVMPKSVAKELRNYIKYDIFRVDTPVDRAFNVTAGKASQLLSQLTKGRVALNLNAATLLGPFRRLGFWSGLGLRIKSPIRNLGQRMLLTDLYSTTAIAKAQLAQVKGSPMIAHPITGELVELMDHIKEQKWYRLTISKFEDTVDDTPLGMRSMTGRAVKQFERVSLAAYSASHRNNVHVAAMTGYFEWRNMYEASRPGTEHYKRCVKEAVRRKVPLDSLLTQESDMDWQMREAVRRTQWEYFTTSMPSMIRGQVSRAAFQFQSWWMNYYANHTRAMVSQTLTGLNDKGRLLPKGGRARSLKGLGTIYAMGKVVEDVAGIAVLKFLLFPTADPLAAPIPQFLGAVLSYLFSGNDRERKMAAKKIKQTMKFWVPYSLALRDAYGVLTGDMDLSDLLFYKQKEGKYK